jgi:hypothetical protein
MLARLWFLPIFTLLGACNMVISETPIFAENDRATSGPKIGIWLAEMDDCRFDSSQPESEWPECALWVVIRDSGREVLLVDGKGQSQRVDYLIAAGTPAIIQGKWIDEAKEPEEDYYGFYGLERRQVAPDGFAAALTWSVRCGVQEPSSSRIQPFPGISAECRPSSKDAIRSAAVASRNAGEVMSWRWIRAEGR